MSVPHRTERGDIISLLLQGGLKKQNSLRLCDGSLMQVGRSHPEEWHTSLKMVLCKSTRPDSTTFTHEWSWSLRTALLHPRSFTQCLWGERDAPHRWPWWRPTEPVSALSSRGTPGPQRVTSAPPCSCRNTTEFLWIYRTLFIWVMHIMPTSLVCTRSEELGVMALCFSVIILLQWKNVNCSECLRQEWILLITLPKWLQCWMWFLWL